MRSLGLLFVLSLLVGLQSPRASARETSLKYSEWAAKLSKSFTPTKVLRLEGLFSLEVPEQNEALIFYAIVHAQREKGLMRADFFGSDGTHTLIYRDSKIQLGEASLSVKANTYNDFLLQIVKLLLGQNLEGGLLGPDKHKWTYDFQKNQQSLSVRPLDENLDLDKIELRLDANEKLSLLKAHNKNQKLGMVFEVKARGVVANKEALWTPAYKIESKNVAIVLKRILRR